MSYLFKERGIVIVNGVEYSQSDIFFLGKGVLNQQDDHDKPLEVKKNDLTTNVSKKAKAKGSSKHNKARRAAFLARKKKRRKNK